MQQPKLYTYIKYSLDKKFKTKRIIYINRDEN